MTSAPHLIYFSSWSSAVVALDVLGILQFYIVPGLIQVCNIVSNYNILKS